MQRIITLTIFSFFLILLSCTEDPKSNLNELNLLEYGLPISIFAPKDASVKVADRKFWKDVIITGDKNYGINIVTSQAFTINAADLKKDELADVKENRYFSKIIKDEDNGFIYETIVDTTNISYDFRYFMVEGDREYRFQSMPNTYTQKEIELLYDAVQPIK